jgi:hypothetical protein
MKKSLLALALVPLLALAGGLYAAEKVESKVAGCCQKAIDAGNTCAHACCVEAAKEGNNCTKCKGSGKIQKKKGKKKKDS